MRTRCCSPGSSCATRTGRATPRKSSAPSRTCPSRTTAPSGSAGTGVPGTLDAYAGSQPGGCEPAFGCVRRRTGRVGVDNDGHYVYGEGSSCADRATVGFLTTGKLPAEDVYCTDVKTE
ncbi:MAG: hypothetical protein HOY76_32990 [Streptomyces sp.]|nr:hypothetical protein [Streptomyces sp.]